MNQDRRTELQDQCVKSLEDARKILLDCYQEIEDDLIKMKEKEDELRGNSKNIEENKTLRPQIKPTYHDTYDASKDLTTPLNDMIDHINQNLSIISEFFANWQQYENVIDKEFSRHVKLKKAKFDQLNE